MQGDDQPPLTQADWSSLLSIFQPPAQPQQQPQAAPPMPPRRPANIGMTSQPSPMPQQSAYRAQAPVAPPAPVAPAPSPYGTLQPPSLPDNSANPQMALALSRQPQSPNYVPPAPAQPAQAQPQGDQGGMLASLLKRGLISAEQFAGAIGGGLSSLASN